MKPDEREALTVPLEPVVGPSKVCTYDNPSTMTRECWQDGKLLCSYSALLLEAKPMPGQQPIPREYFFHGANIGPWKAGQHWGDIDAIKPNAGLSGGTPKA